MAAAGEEEGEDLITQYVTELNYYSSEYGFKSTNCYSADNCIGESSHCNYGDFTRSVVFRTYGDHWAKLPYYRSFPSIGHTPDWFRGTDFIDVSFPEAVYPVCLFLWQTLCPGALVRVLASDHGTVMSSRHLSRWKVLWSSKEKADPHQHTIAKIKFPKLNKKSFRTHRLRLEFNSSLSEYYFEFNAVNLEGYKSLPVDKEKAAKSHAKEVVKNRVMATTTVKIPVKELEKLKLTDNRPVVKVNEKECFISRVPPEVLTTIFSYLPDAKDQAQVQRTCRLFDQCLLRGKEMNFKPFWNSLTGAALTGFADRVPNITRLDLSWTGVNGMIKGSDVVSALTQLPYLVHLSCANCEDFVDDEFLVGINQFTQLQVKY